MFWILVLISSLQLWSCQEVHNITGPQAEYNSAPNPSASSFQKYVVGTFTKVNWFQASEICHRSDMILATVNSFEHHLQVIRVVALSGGLQGLEKFWLGATNLVNLRSWTWMDMGIPLGYKKWASGEPQSDLIGKEGCLLMDLNDSWSSDDCHKEHYFVCERACNSNKNLEPLYL